MSQYYEPAEEMQQQDRDYVRALYSMKEEIEAVAWYHQRVATCADEQLKKVLAHNRDEEMEHACMIMEWLRRNMPGWEEQLRTYLFTAGDITAIEEGESEASPTGGAVGAVDLGIGSLKK